MNKDIYVIDSCALINASKNYNMKKQIFSNIWMLLSDLAKSGKLISSQEVKEELLDDDLINWSKENKSIFIPLTEEIQRKATEILKDYPNMIKISTKGSSNADPFLIATAMIYGGVVVSDEGGKQFGIPYVCKELGVKCINFIDLLDIFFE